MEKERVGIIFGGKSMEHEVSLMSATSVIKAVNEEKYSIVKIGITKKGEWKLFHGDVESIQDGSWEKMATKLEIGTLPEIIDIALPILHGPFGEDGKIQGLFEMLDIPYCGCGVLASAVAMDKIMAKLIFEKVGLTCGPYVYFTKAEIRKKPAEIIENIEKKLKYPLFVKPSNLGSSVGITKATNKDELINSINIALDYDSRIIIEEGINAREIEVAVLGNDTVEAGELGEIEPKCDFYDFDSKYSEDAGEQLTIPASLDNALEKEIKEKAMIAYKALDCRGYSRVDFFLEKETNKVYINEINTIPGFTNYSMYPMMWEAAGVGYTQLIERILELGYERYNIENNR